MAAADLFGPKIALSVYLPFLILSRSSKSLQFTHSLTHSFRSLIDRWGIKDDRATTFLHSSLSSAFRRASPNPNPVHSDMLSFHLIFFLPLLLSPRTVPCRIIFASPVDLVMCPNHLNLRFLTVLIRSSYGPIACLIL